MNVVTGGTQQVRQLNPELLTATLLVDAVRREIIALIPLAQQQGSVSVSQTSLQQWMTALQGAVSLLGRIPAPLIFPPPAFVTFANGATNQINQALATLQSIPVVAPLIFPPQPGQATVSPEILQSIQTDLQQAELLLLQALQTA